MSYLEDHLSLQIFFVLFLKNRLNFSTTNPLYFSSFHCFLFLFIFTSSSDIFFLPGGLWETLSYMLPFPFSFLILCLYFVCHYFVMIVREFFSCNEVYERSQIGLVSQTTLKHIKSEYFSFILEFSLKLLINLVIFSCFVCFYVSK